MKRHLRKKVIIITVIVLILGICSIILLNYGQQPKTFDILDEHYIATRTITLPDGNNIQTKLANDQHKIGWIGATLTELTPAIKNHLNYSDPYGVYVQDTFRNSPAQTAGLLPGDIITQINNIDAEEVLATLHLISSLKPGNSYPITVYRHGKYLMYAVTVTDKHYS